MQELGTYRNRIVTTAIGDNQASFLGAVGNENGTLLVNIGTGGQISVLSDQYFAEDGIEARPFLDGKYLLVGASLCGGKSLCFAGRIITNLFADNFTPEAFTYGVLEGMALELYQMYQIIRTRNLYPGHTHDWIRKWSAKESSTL